MAVQKKTKWAIGALAGVLALVGAGVVVSGPGGLGAERSRRNQLPGAVKLPDQACERLKEVKLAVREVRDGNNRVTASAVDALCTHGPDPAPPGVDFKTPRRLGEDPPLASLPIPIPTPGAPPDGPITAASVFPGIGCYGDGQSGNRVQAVYASPADRPDRYDQVVASIRQWAADTDAVFQASAAKTGGLRRVRFVTDGGCNLVVQRVRVSAGGDDTFDNTAAELQAQGLSRSDRKYLVWMDSTVLCGVASMYNDDRPTGNANDGRAGIPGSVARVDSGCWGLASRGQSVEAHELMHSLGAVMRSAPNASAAGHCTDDSDRMCYQDGTVAALRNLCAPNQENLFDCANDDYFHTAPGAGSYLATHWDAANSSFLSSVANEQPPAPVNPVGPVDTTPKGQGYWFVASDGGIFNYADAKFFGSTGAIRLNQPVVGLARTPSGKGYWLVARDGGIFSFGDARFFGSTGGIRLNQPIVGMAATPSGKGYWFVAADGGIFNYGDAGFFGSTGSTRLNRPIVGMAATPSGQGYWQVGADGAVYAFGDAGAFGNPGGGVERPVVGIAATPTGRGYWLAGQGGTVYAFGDAGFKGGTANLNRPIVGLTATPTGQGYWLVASDGGIFSFGDARFFGSTGAIRLNQPIVGMAAAPAA